MEPQQPTTPGPPFYLAASLSLLPTWVTSSLPDSWWTLDRATLEWLPEQQLIAIYRVTRHAPSSSEARLAAAAMINVYRQGVLALVGRYAPRGRVADATITSHEPAELGVTDRDDNRRLTARDQELNTQGWLAFFAAVENYTPRHKTRLLTFAAYGIKEALIKQLLSNMPQEPHSDDTRKAWDRALETWARLGQEWGRQPRPEEVADYLAPQLLPAIATVDRARRAILDVFRILVDNRVRLDDPDADEYEPPQAPQLADTTWEPALLIAAAEARQGARSELRRVFDAAAAKIGDSEATIKLLALRVLLNVKEVDGGKPMDYGMYKIKEFLNAPDAEIALRWRGLWIDYGLGQLGLPQQWSELRLLFDPPVEVAELRAFYGFYLDVAGWDQPRE